MRRAYVVFAATMTILIGAVYWLRDPAWLATVESGFGQWQVDAQQTKYRWTAGRASFFVPSSTAEIRIPVRPGRETEGWPIVVTMSVDDRVVDRLSLTSNVWHLSRVRLPPPGARHVRRIDIHVDRTIDGSRGVQIGEIQTTR